MLASPLGASVHLSSSPPSNADPLPPLEGSFVMDVLMTSFRFVLSITLIFFGSIYISQDATFLFGIIMYFVGVLTLIGALKRYVAVYQYMRAKNATGLYLNNVRPTCPYLKVGLGGFNCMVEFGREFDLAEDLPKCHSRVLYEKHWVEKAPGVLEQAKVETGVAQLASWISLLGRTKHEQATSFLLEIAYAPPLQKSTRWLFEELSIDQPQLLTDLAEKYYQMSQLEVEGGEEGSQNQTTLEDSTITVTRVVQALERFGVVYQEEGEVGLTDKGSYMTAAKWKTQTHSVVKNMAIAALGMFKNPDLLPDFLFFLENAKDKREFQIILQALGQLGPEALPSLQEAVMDENISDESRPYLLQAIGALKSPESVPFLVRFLEEEEDELLLAYAVTALGEVGTVEAKEHILDVLEDDPEDVVMSSGRNSLAKTPTETIPLVMTRLDQEELTQSFLDILTSVLEEIGTPVLRRYLSELGPEEREQKEKLVRDWHLTELFGIEEPL